MMVIFDLDGTLLDTSEGIFNCVRYVECNLGLQPIETEQLKVFIGPPPKEMYRKVYGLSEEMSSQAVDFHREYGNLKAVYEAEVYEGIVEVLQWLKERKYLIGVATLKREKTAKKILEIHNLSQYFDIICGMNDKESLTKKELIVNMLKKYNVSSAVLIGDTIYDYLAAKESGIEFLPVCYGFGYKNVDEKEIRDCCVIEEPRQIIYYFNEGCKNEGD